MMNKKMILLGIAAIYLIQRKRSNPWAVDPEGRAEWEDSKFFTAGGGRDDLLSRGPMTSGPSLAKSYGPGYWEDEDVDVEARRNPYSLGG